MPTCRVRRETILCWDNLDVGTTLIDRHADTRFVIDHPGILQPLVPDDRSYATQTGTAALVCPAATSKRFFMETATGLRSQQWASGAGAGEPEKSFSSRQATPIITAPSGPDRCGSS